MWQGFSLFVIVVLVVTKISFSFFFFFSSRRRHTRYIGDWSSDVCSSDLLAIRNFDFAPIPADFVTGRGAMIACIDRNGIQENAVRIIMVVARRVAFAPGGRSEERRVGKECRSRWAREH